MNNIVDIRDYLSLDEALNNAIKNLIEKSTISFNCFGVQYDLDGWEVLNYLRGRRHG